MAKIRWYIEHDYRELKAAWALTTSKDAPGPAGSTDTESCPHSNACLNCALFITTAEFLPQHRAQLNDTRAQITRAQSAGHARLAEMNRTVETNLPSP